MNQIQKLTQSQIFAPQLAQSLEILQVPALELRKVILQEMQSNPTLEEIPLEEDFSKLSNDFEYDIPKCGNYNEEEAKRHQFVMDSLVIEESLEDHILEQAKLFDWSSEQLKALEFLIGNLDEKGFLTISLKDIAKQSNLSEKMFKDTLQLLKFLDPVGIGSRDIQECLLIQLEALGKKKSLSAEIVKNYYPLLLKRKIPEIAKQLSSSIEVVQDAIEEIASLDPAPGRKYGENTNRTVLPDAIIEKINDQWIISLNDEYIPKLQLSKTYKDFIAKGQLSEKEKTYIREKMKAGRFILNAIDQRQKTVQKITEAILHFQNDFFEKGTTALHALTMTQVGDYLSIHETTVSRACANKFLATPYGIFPYKYFFTSGFKNQNEKQNIANIGIKEAIFKIIQSEVPNKPFSDQKIANILAEENLSVARRTVAKYREELGIASANLRRKY